jgi:hypothetical protein
MLIGVAKEMKSVQEIPKLIKELYGIVDSLEALFPGRHFTPDGHLVGSIGEVLAAYYYDLELLPASAEGHDAEAKDGRKVQIKATQRKSIGIRSCPQHLIVMKIFSNGDTKEVFNSPGKLAWDNTGKMQKNGQRSISLTKLAKLMKEIPEKSRLPRAFR